MALAGFVIRREAKGKTLMGRNAGSTGIRVVEQAWYVFRGPFFLAATQRNTQYGLS